MTQALVTDEYNLIISNGNTLYVGRSGPGNYTKIQDAIDNATDGDTVFVYDYSSPYYEHVVVDKSIKLIGENKDTTIIDGSGFGDVVYITTNYVTIEGFTIQNSGNNTWDDGGIAGIFIDEITNNNTINGNIITNNYCGINCYKDVYDSSDYHIISENIITNNLWGIFLDKPFKIEVYENYIENNKFFGIYVGSSVYPSKSINYLKDKVYNNIYRNTITKNDNGIYMDLAIYINVFENNITNNNYGIHLTPSYLCPCYQNNIYQNNINNNTYGIFAGADGGDIIKNSISKNNIMYNSEGIIFIVYDNDYGFYYVIERNKISYNNFIGNTNTVSFKYSLFNRWVGNYWGKARLLPYPLIGKLKVLNYIFPWITFDWRPAKEPYDIP